MIGRAILKAPRILILDEATSHLDTLSEQLIQASLHGLFNNWTSLVIAHRFATVLAADQLLVMNLGLTVEPSTHRGLVEQDRLYATN